MHHPPRTTVYYNSACPVCDAGIRSEREHLAACPIDWVDVHLQPGAAEELGAGLEDVRRRLHVVDAHGRTLVGIEAIAEMWSQAPGRRWLARVLRLPGVRSVAAFLYDAFAAALYRWNRRRGHWEVA